MDIEETAKELDQIQISHPQAMAQIADALSVNGEAGVLIWLKQRREETFAIDITQHFGLTAGRVANIIRKLEEKGFLERKTLFEDQRKSQIVLTEKGLLYAESLHQKMNKNHNLLLESLGEENAAQAAKFLKHLIISLENNKDFKNI